MPAPRGIFMTALGTVDNVKIQLRSAGAEYAARARAAAQDAPAAAPGPETGEAATDVGSAPEEMGAATRERDEKRRGSRLLQRVRHGNVLRDVVRGWASVAAAAPKSARGLQRRRGTMLGLPFGLRMPRGRGEFAGAFRRVGLP